MQMSPLIAVHMSAALGALVLGPVAIWARKGAVLRPRVHRAFGYGFVPLMLTASTSAMFIRDYNLPNIEGFTPIHLLIPFTLLGLWASFYALYKGNTRCTAKLWSRFTWAPASPLAPLPSCPAAIWGS